MDADLVRGLVREQFPQWAHLPVEPVLPGGWDNRTFRLGPELSVRLPSGPGYAPQVEREQRWLPRLAPHLPLPVPEPVAHGAPGHGFPFPWSVYRWLPGDTLAARPVADAALARDLAGFLCALRGVDARGGPPPGPHNGFRGGDLAIYDAETRRSVAALGDRVDADAALAVWDAAGATAWDAPPVWFHGDVAAGNLLVRDGRLAAVIDFGCAGVGDPACDLVIAWTLLDAPERAVFRDALGLDDATWARGRGWALWKALLTMAEDQGVHANDARPPGRVVDHVLGDGDPGRARSCEG